MERYEFQVPFTPCRIAILIDMDNDDVDISSLGNGKFLKYNSTTGKLEFTDEVGTYSFS